MVLVSLRKGLPEFGRKLILYIMMLCVYCYAFSPERKCTLRRTFYQVYACNKCFNKNQLLLPFKFLSVFLYQLVGNVTSTPAGVSKEHLQRILTFEWGEKRKRTKRKRGFNCRKWFVDVCVKLGHSVEQEIRGYSRAIDQTTLYNDRDRRIDERAVARAPLPCSAVCFQELLAVNYCFV